MPPGAEKLTDPVACFFLCFGVGAGSQDRFF